MLDALNINLLELQKWGLVRECKIYLNVKINGVIMDTNEEVTKKYSDLESEVKNLVFHTILREEERLLALFLGAAERAIKILFLLNAGGVATILAYIANKGANGLLIGSMLSFIVGIIAAMIVVGWDYQYTSNRFSNFQADAAKYLNDEILFYEIKQFKTKSRWSSCIIVLIGYLSAACILIGIALGILGYLSNYKNTVDECAFINELFLGILQI